MEASIAAATLRALADELRLASITLRAHAKELKETSWAIGDEAAKIAYRILSDMKINVLPSRWADYSEGSFNNAELGKVCTVLPALRKLLQKPVDPLKDGAAYKTCMRLTGNWPDPNIETITEPASALTERERARFYFEQARDWAKLLELLADSLRDLTNKEKFLNEYNLRPTSETGEEARSRAAEAVGLQPVPTRQNLNNWSKELGIPYIKRRGGRMKRSDA